MWTNYFSLWLLCLAKGWVKNLILLNWFEDSGEIKFSFFNSRKRFFFYMFAFGYLARFWWPCVKSYQGVMSFISQVRNIIFSAADFWKVHTFHIFMWWFLLQARKSFVTNKLCVDFFSSSTVFVFFCIFFSVFGRCKDVVYTLVLFHIGLFNMVMG